MMPDQSTSPNNPQPLPWWMYATVLAASLVLFVWHLGGEVSDGGLQLFTRHTARLSFSIFILAFIARPAAALAPSSFTRYLVRKRRHLGLAFALAHFIHLGAIVAFFVGTEQVPEAIAVIFGGLGYVFIAALALTSNDRAVRALGKNWKRLHTAGIYYVWFIFTQSYAGRAFAGAEEGAEAAAPSTPAAYQALLAVALLALTLRAWHRWSRRKNRRQKPR